MLRSESEAVDDVNHDGKLDVLAGGVRYYRPPTGERHAIRNVGEYHGEKGYRQSFANWPYDVNVAGRDTVIGTQFVVNDFYRDKHPGILSCRTKKA